MSLKYPFMNGCANLPKDKDEDVKKVRKWLETQPHLPYLNDDYLHLFLYANEYKFEETKKNIESYITFRAEMPDLFTNRSPYSEEMQSVFNMTYYGVLPDRTPEGYKVIIIKYSDLDPNKYIYYNLVKTGVMIYDVLISEFGLCPGYIFVFDSEGVTWSHFWRMNMGLARKASKYMEEGLPLQMKGMCTVNALPIMHKMFAIFKPFMSERTIRMIHIFDSNLTDFYKIVPKEMLPQEYGGPMGTMKSLHEDFVKLVTTKYVKWLEEDKPLTIDESKKPKGSWFSFW